MSKALCIGVDREKKTNVFDEDASRIGKLLSKNEDGSTNFHTEVINGENTMIDRTKVLSNFRKLINSENEMAVFYYSGHGTMSELGTYLNTVDANTQDPGVSVNDLVEIANGNNKTRQIVIILDCCFSGGAGNGVGFINNTAVLRKGLSILTASEDFEVSRYQNYKSVFTSILEAGLSGEAADEVGHVSVASLYNYADKLLGPWEQRPLLKTHTSRLRPLRQCKPKISEDLIRQINNYFPDPKKRYALDSTFVGSSTDSDPNKVLIFRELQELCRNALVKPVNEEHMYYAAMNSKSCELTLQGKMYWRMVDKGMV